MEIKERYIENELSSFIACMLFGIFISILMTILSIHAYYIKDIGFGFAVFFAIMGYIWVIVCFVIGIREIIVVRNNQIIEYIFYNQDNTYLIMRSTIDNFRSDIEKLRKEINQCKKMKK